ncbi:hypothetical protein lerEdw1_018892 [Lerista edwardsae]|nr:hypothetical protein lerEdw1_018892 [Lerista edwardsae]
MNHLYVSCADRDQQKREKLIKAVEKYKKQMVRSPSAPPFHSRSITTEHHTNLLNSLNLASSERAPSSKQRQQYSVKHFKHPLSRIQAPELSVEATVQDIVQWSLAQAHKTSRNATQRHPLIYSSLPILSSSRKKTFQPAQKKKLGGDLLQTHAQWFTETKQHFTPRVLKATSKSFLSNYRYYNPPQRKNLKEKQSYQGPRQTERSLEDKCLRSYANYVLQHPVKVKCSQDSVSLQSLIHAKEEELKYLQFLQEVTNDILIRSCYHKEALGDVFQRHIGNRRCDLDEVKMQRIVQALKDDLSISTNLPDPSIRYTGFEYRNRLIAPYT